MNIGRRNFLKMLGISAGTAGATSLIKPSVSPAQANVPGVPPFGPPQQEGELDWQQIDADHKEKVDLFLANIGTEENFWRNNFLDFEMDGDTKVFQITTTNVMWETEPGKAIPAFAYNGEIPGPSIRMTEGDRVRFVVNNEMNQSTSIHWHGVDVPNDQDGVPYITQPPIEPGQTYVYEFTAPNPGSHMYHAHHNSLEQVVGGLLGAFIIDPLDTSREPEYDSEYIMILNDSALGFTINGRSYPYTQPILAQPGERIRLRYYNEGLMIHPMHLHGQPQWVFMKDGYYYDSPFYVDTLNIAPGERYDVIIEARPGKWAFHCHILSHVETRQGLFGMVTALVVAEEE